MNRFHRHFADKLLPVAAVLALAGCGASSQSKPSADSARSTVKAFFTDLRDGHFGDACDLMTDAGRKQVGNGNVDACGGRMALALALLGKKAINDLIAKADTLPITVHGNTATSPPLTSGDSPGHLVFTGGHWLID